MVARIPSGKALVMEPQSSEGRTRLTGRLTMRGGHYLLTDETTNVTVELAAKEELANQLGRRVEVTGLDDPAATPASDATQVIEVAQVDAGAAAARDVTRWFRRERRWHGGGRHHGWGSRRRCCLGDTGRDHRWSRGGGGGRRSGGYWKPGGEHGRAGEPLNMFCARLFAVITFAAFTLAAGGTLRLAIGESSERPARLNPRDSSAWMTLGLEAEQAGDVNRAAESLLRAEKVDRQYLPAWTAANFFFRHANDV